MMAKSYIIELESERKRCQDLTNQIHLLNEEHMGVIKQLEQLKISNLDLKKQQKSQKRRNSEIKKQLTAIRRELRELVVKEWYYLSRTHRLLSFLSFLIPLHLRILRILILFLLQSLGLLIIMRKTMDLEFMKSQLLSPLLCNSRNHWCLLKLHHPWLMK